MDPKKIKGKEFFTIELDLAKNNVTLFVNGELRRTTKVENHLHGSGESLF